MREALVALDREGWVTIEPHRGAFVHGVDADWVRDHYDILSVLYGLAAARAAVRGTADDRAHLHELHRTFKRSSAPDAFDAANHALLQHVLSMARAPRLVTALRAVTSIVPGNFFVEVPNTIPTQRRGIAAIVRAIVAHDVDESRASVERLLARQGNAVVGVLTDRGVLAEFGR